MNCSKYDIYFLVILFLFMIIFYKIYNLENKNNENFAVTDDIKTAINQVYTADIEAIRNLSSIATKLTISGGLVVPGKLQINDDITISGNLLAKKICVIGKSGDNISSTVSDSVHNANTMCIVGQDSSGAGSARQIKMWDNVKISNDLNVGNGLTVANGLTITNGKLNLPNNTSFSADGDDATHWLRLQQTNNPSQYKSLAVKDLWCNASDGNLFSRNITNDGDVTIKGTLRIGNIPIWNEGDFLYFGKSDKTKSIRFNISNIGGWGEHRISHGDGGGFKW